MNAIPNQKVKTEETMLDFEITFKDLGEKTRFPSELDTSKLKLDVGCGGSEQYCANTVRGDINVDVRKPLKKVENFVLCDVNYLPFPEGLFQKVFFYDVIEHLENPFKALSEIYNVLCEKGVVELSTPNSLHWRNFFRAMRDKDLLLTCDCDSKYKPDHIVTWTDAEMRSLLLKAGFSEIAFNWRILAITLIHDPRHAKIDLMVFKLFPFFKRVTARAMIVSAMKTKVNGRNQLTFLH
jgi:SAM-dependent methyltransferase